jgi:hypothetical protein
MSLRNQPFKIIKGAVFRVNAVIINHIIFVITGGWLNRRQPNGFNAQILQIIQFGGNTVKVTNVVPIGIAERANKDFVTDARVIRQNYSRLGLEIFSPLIALKSRSLSVSSVNLCIKAVAAIIASGVFNLYLRLSSIVLEAISSESG